MSDIFVKDPLTDPRAPDVAEVPILHTFEEIVTHFAPITIDRSLGWDATPVGQACWKLVGFHVTVGIQEISPIVLNPNGDYLPDKWVNWHFPGVPEARSHDPPYFPKGLSAQTKGPPDNNGAHFTVTGDHNVAPDHAGPDTVWVAAEPGGPQFSDAVRGLGMRVNTNHLIVSPIFQHVVKAEESPSEEDKTEETGEPGQPDETPDSTSPPAPDKQYLSIVIDDQEIGRIPFEPAGSE